MSSDQPYIRQIKSYVRREGKLTRGQQRALDELSADFVCELTAGELNFTHAFGNNNPVVLEIGFGMGESLLTLASQHSDKNYIGVDVHRPGIGKILLGIEKQELTNLKVYCADVIDVLNQAIPLESLDEVLIFFPDPWHKKRHHKRRLIQTAFIELLLSKLKPGGLLHIATDWENYAEHIMQVLSQESTLINTAGHNQYAARPESRPLTKYEQRGERLGHGVWDLLFSKVN